MNLKKRLILANASTVVIPVMVTVLMALAYIFVFGKLLGHDVSLESYQRLSHIKFELINSQTSILKSTPEVIIEESFQSHLHEQIAEINGELLMIKNDKLIFSSRDFTKIEIAKLQAAGKKGIGERTLIGDISYDVQLIDLNFKDGSLGSVILLAPVDRSAADLTSFLMFIGLTFVLTFVFTNVVVSYQFSKSIIKPLNNLQGVASEISRGNLDYRIVEEGDQEIQALCRDFELMRIKLKDTVLDQMKYEENRKILISSISHDLKTPVTSIKGYVEGILDGIADTPSKTERYLKTISLKAHQVDQMIDDLLLYANLDLNQIPFDFEKTDIEEYLKFCLSESEPDFERNQIKISFHNEQCHKPQYVMIDRERMKRVINNILDNSCKYMGRNQGEIKILLRDTFSSVIIEFRDNGSGIAERDLPHIFDRFYRADAARSKGSGLGLAIAKQIIEGHSGRVWAISHGEEGTSIMISLSKL